MASLYRFSSFNNSDTSPGNQTSSTGNIAGNTMPDMNQSHNYSNMNIPVPLQNMNVNMKVPMNMGMNMNVGMNMNMGMGMNAPPPMSYSSQNYPVSSSVPHAMNVGIPVASANYAHNPPTASNPFPSSNKPNMNNSNTMKVGLVSQLGYSEKDSYDPRSSTLSITPNNQVKSPLSPLFYQQNSSVNGSSSNTNVSKGTVMYPLTPQTLNSQQAQSPLSPPNYENRVIGTYSNRDSNKLREMHPVIRNREDEAFDEDNEKNEDHGGKRELFYELSSKTYVYKSREEGRDGLRSGSLIKPDNENENGNGGSRKKKLSSSGNESDDDEDSDGKEDENKNPEKRDASSSRSRNKRSRGGCLTCRQRKKRCCESKPICSECKRLNIKCRWPVPGSERKNKSKNQPHMSHDEVYHEIYGVIKVLRGVVDYKIEP